MKEKFFNLKTITLIVLGVLLVFPTIAQNRVLVSGTDFEPLPGKEVESWIAISDVTTKGVLTPSITINASQPGDKGTKTDIGYDKNASGKVTSSHFQSNKDLYAITKNPIILDSLDFIDDPTNKWGIVFNTQSQSAAGSNKGIINISLKGLKPLSGLEVKIEWRTVVAKTAQSTALKDCGNGSGRAEIRVSCNGDSNNRYTGTTSNQIGMPDEDVIDLKSNSITDSKKLDPGTVMAANENGEVDLNIIYSMFQPCCIFEITSIEIYGELDPQIFAPEGNDVCAGEYINLKARSVYNGATYQWLKNGSPISGATSASYMKETSVNDDGTDTYQLEVKYGGKTFTSNELKINVSKCCTEKNELGEEVAASRKTIFMDDFGRFDLSDPSGKTYITKDYSDIKNPKEVSNTTATPFRYQLKEAPLNTSFAATGVVDDKSYCVAGVLTDNANSHAQYKGAALGWSNRITGKGAKDKDMPIGYDHSGELEGCCLLINCPENTKGQVIYEQEITNLCENKRLFFECWYTVFTNGAKGDYNPVDITLRVEEIDNEDANHFEVSGDPAYPVYAGGSGEWMKLGGEIYLDKKDALRFKIINNNDVSDNGNDLVLDDIIIRACAAPSLMLYFDDVTLDVDTITCDNIDDQLNLFAVPSTMLTDYFGGKSNTYYLYQWTKTPKDKKSWKNLGSLTQDLSLKIGLEPFNGVADGDVLYFRAIAGGHTKMNSTAESDFNADDPCASYTISEAIPCVISCPTCTKPENLIIASTMTTSNTSPYKVVQLCKGDQTTLSTKDVSDGVYDQYRISWYKNKMSSSPINSTIGVMADPIDVLWEDATASGTMYYVKVYDDLYPDATSCYKYDSIQIISNIVPEVDDITLTPFCDNDPDRAKMLDNALSSIPTYYEITWYKDTVTPTKGSEPDVAGATPSTDPYVSFFTVTDKNTKCVSKYYTFTFTVKEVPEETLALIDPFCEYVDGAKSTSVDATDAPSLPESVNSYDVDWYNSSADLTSGNKAVTNLSSLQGSTTPYTYYYTLSLDGCTSDPVAYEFTVKPIVKQTALEKVNECDKTTLTVTTKPSDATSKWSNGKTGKSISFETETEAVADYSVTSSSNGYCESEKESITSDFYKTPPSLGDYSVQYLKADGKATNGVFSNDKLLNVIDGKAAAGATVKWIGQENSSTIPSDTHGATDTPNQPKADNVNDSKDETHYYFIYQQIAYSASVTCPSEFSTIEVKILGAPAPDVTPVSYCLNDTPDLVTSFAKTTSGGATDTKTYSLAWFEKESDYPSTPMSGIPTIVTSEVGVKSYYVAQWDDSDHNNISSLQHVDVTTYGVPTPSSETPINYCKNEIATQLTATAGTGANEYWVSNGFKWIDNGTETTTAPTPNTSTVGDISYSVIATYSTTSLVCESEPFDITVTVSETKAPSTQTVQYIKADAASDGMSFPSLDKATNNAWKTETTEPDFDYYYSAISESKTQPATGFSKGIPSPSFDVSKLSGNTQELYCYVYREDKNNPKACPSDTILITIKISDALPPVVKDVYVCEDSEIPSLEAEIALLPGAGKTESDYELVWYGDKDPNSDNTATGSHVGESTYPMGNKGVSVDNKKTEYYYYVTQREIATGAESTPSKITVTVLPKPVAVPKEVPAQCEGEVNLNNWYEVTNASECGSPLTPTYKDGNDKVESTGEYAFTVSYPLGYTSPDYIVNSVDQCVSEEAKIKVVIDKLDSVYIEGDTTVCPGGQVSLDAKIISSTHDGTQCNYYWENEQFGSQTNSSWTNIYPMTFASENDKIYRFKMKATAGTCEKESEVHIVKVGNGQVRGLMTVTEADNSWRPISFTNDTVREFYSCGGAMTIDINYEKTEGDFKWTMNGADYQTGNSITIAETTASSDKTYEVLYVNKCDTKAKIIVHTIPLTVVPEISRDTLCEGESFTTKLNITCDETPEIQWYLNSNPITNANSATYTKSSVLESEDDGQYSYKVTNRGCTREGDSRYLDVQRYMKVTDFTEPFIVNKNTDKTIELQIDVPEKSLGVEIDKIEWVEKGESKQSSSSSSYTETAVVSDHTYEISLTDNDYCSTSTTATIWVEADLQLKTDLKDTICLGSSAILTIDTTGTGAFRKANVPHSLTVVRYMKGHTDDVTSDLRKNGDMLEMEVSPTDSASYTITFTYDDQKVGPIVEIVNVIQAIDLTLPPVSTICEGDTIKLGVSDVTPEGTTVSWKPAETIISGIDTDTIIAVPTYTESLNHQFTYNYIVTATNKKCDESKDYIVPVKVDEALKGTPVGSEVICEGAQGKIDASSYQAATYEWTANEEFVSSSATALVNPVETTLYKVAMTRGVCTAKDSFEMEVTSLPVITSIDSVDIRDREIVMEPGKGTGVFYYWIDVESSKATDNTVYNLTFSKHVAYVRDENGCQTSKQFEVLPPPVIIPEFFTPNGDGVNDNWVVEVLRQVYPDAKVQIFDRFGKMMAEYLGGDSEGWDGTYKGNPMPSTDYWYVIDIEEIDRQYTGHFTLIRQ